MLSLLPSPPPTIKNRLGQINIFLVLPWSTDRMSIITGLINLHYRQSLSRGQIIYVQTMGRDSLSQFQLLQVFFLNHLRLPWRRHLHQIECLISPLPFLPTLSAPTTSQSQPHASFSRFRLPAAVLPPLVMILILNSASDRTRRLGCLLVPLRKMLSAINWSAGAFLTFRYGFLLSTGFFGLN